MHADNTLDIEATPEEIYSVVSDVVEWPRLLPHYRSVRVLSEGDGVRVARMAARRGRIPVSWTAEQRLFPDEPRMTFRHVRGVTSGMDVEWSFTPIEGGTRVAIHHDLLLRWPLIGGLVADHIIGPFFIRAIAGRTLRRFKEIVEAQGAQTVRGRADAVETQA